MTGEWSWVMVYPYFHLTYTLAHWFLFVQFYEFIVLEGANMLTVVCQIHPWFLIPENLKYRALISLLIQSSLLLIQ